MTDQTCSGTLYPEHRVGHPYVARRDGTLWCLACYARVFGRPVIDVVDAPTGTRDRLVTA